MLIHFSVFNKTRLNLFTDIDQWSRLNLPSHDWNYITPIRPRGNGVRSPAWLSRDAKVAPIVGHFTISMVNGHLLSLRVDLRRNDGLISCRHWPGRTLAASPISMTTWNDPDLEHHQHISLEHAISGTKEHIMKQRIDQESNIGLPAPTRAHRALLVYDSWRVDITTMRCLRPPGWYVTLIPSKVYSRYRCYDRRRTKGNASSAVASAIYFSNNAIGLHGESSARFADRSAAASSWPSALYRSSRARSPSRYATAAEYARRLIFHRKSRKWLPTVSWCRNFYAACKASVK